MLHWDQVPAVTHGAFTPFTGSGVMWNHVCPQIGWEEGQADQRISAHVRIFLKGCTMVSRSFVGVTILWYDSTLGSYMASAALVMPLLYMIQKFWRHWPRGFIDIGGNMSGARHFG